MQQPHPGFWSTFARSRLGRKFLRDFLIASLLPLLLMGAVSVYLVNSIHRIDIATAEESVVRQKTVEIEKVTDELASLLAVQVVFDAFAPIELNQQQSLLEKLLASAPALREASFLCLTPLECLIGNETSRLVRGGGAVPLRDFARAPEFEAAGRGTTYFGPVETGADDAKTITVAAPVVNKRGSLIAVLRGETSLAPIQGIVKDSRLGETGYLYVVDRTGTIIAHPDETAVGMSAARLPTVGALLSGEERTGLEENAVYPNLKGIEVTGAGSPLKDLGWGVVLEWPRSETQAAVESMLWTIVRFTLGALILILLLTGLTTWSLLKPITQIKEGVGAIGQGNLDYRFRLETGDELEELGEHLNRMTVNLKAVEELRVLKLRTQVLAENLRKERELSQLKDQFINTVSHQFNTPLTVINWTLAAMKDPRIPPEVIQDNLSKIAQSRKDMLAIVNDLLTLSEIGFHYRKTNATVVDIRALAETVIGALKDPLAERKLRITIRETAPHAKVEANAFALTKVLENLIDNAVTYANDGSEILIELGGNEREFLFSIRNDGIGIPVEDKGKVFQQFFRAKNAVTKKNVGTGLGLFIVKTIVEGHDGRVWFVSEENKGAAFFFAIPR